MKKLLILIIFSAISTIDFAAGQTNQQLTDSQKSWVAKANRHEKNGWTYLHIEGTPEEIDRR